MVSSPETAEEYKPIIKIQEKVVEIPAGTKEIVVAAENIGASKWKKMIDLTQNDGAERSIIISTFPKGFITSSIFTGPKPSKGNPHSADPIYPHGLQGLIKRLKPAVYVHSHPKQEVISHLKTTLPSDGDLAFFYASEYGALIAIDPGGTHLILRTHDYRYSEIPSDFIKSKIATAIATGGTIVDVQHDLSINLSRYGFEYFYTPELTPSGQDTFVFKKQ